MAVGIGVGRGVGLRFVPHPGWLLSGVGGGGGEDDAEAVALAVAVARGDGVSGRGAVGIGFGGVTAAGCGDVPPTFGGGSGAGRQVGVRCARATTLKRTIAPPARRVETFAMFIGVTSS